MVLRPIHAIDIKTLLQNVKSLSHAHGVLNGSDYRARRVPRRQGWCWETRTLFWGRGDSVKDFKLRNKNTDLHFRQILTLYTENVTWWEFCLWFLWMSKIITKLHCPRKRREFQPSRSPLESFFAFFPFSKVNPGSRPLLVPGILCWLLFRGE